MTLESWTLLELPTFCCICPCRQYAQVSATILANHDPHWYIARMCWKSVPNEVCSFYYQVIMLFSMTTAVGSLDDAVMLIIEAAAHRVSLENLIAAARKRWASRRLILTGRPRDLDQYGVPTGPICWSMSVGMWLHTDCKWYHAPLWNPLPSLRGILGISYPMIWSK